MANRIFSKYLGVYNAYAHPVFFLDFTLWCVGYCSHIYKNIGAWYRGRYWANARYYNVQNRIAVPKAQIGSFPYTVTNYEFCLSQGLTFNIATEDIIWWEGKQNGYTTPSHLYAWTRRPLAYAWAYSMAHQIISSSEFGLFRTMQADTKRRRRARTIARKWLRLHLASSVDANVSLFGRYSTDL